MEYINIPGSLQASPTSVIKSTTTGPSAHLDVLSRGDPAEASTVKLPYICEYDSLGWHIKARGEGLCMRTDHYTHNESYNSYDGMLDTPDIFQWPPSFLSPVANSTLSKPS